MGTASTMACITEALGMLLPGTAAIPAVHADRLLAAEETGKAAVRLIDPSRSRPRRSITEKSVENAIRVLMAIGGSTNAIVHLTAIAGRLGIKVALERFNELSDETPVLVDLKPVGEGYMEDFHAAGGMGALLRELKRCCTSTAWTWKGGRWPSGCERRAGWVDRAVIRALDDPVGRSAGWWRCAAAWPRTAPSSSAAPRRRRLFESEGRCVVFTGLEDLAGASTIRTST